MKLEYKRELDHNYMILEEQQETAKEGYEIYMLEENRIPGLLKCTLQRLNQQQRFCYEVTSRQPLDIILERKRLTYGDLMGLLKGIYTALQGAREYLLDVNRLMLRPEYIYLNLDTDTPELCYFPYYEKPVQEQFFELAEYLLGKLDRQDRAGVELGYEIYKMASEENCSIEEIIKLQEQKPDSCVSAKKVRLSWENPKETAIVRKIAEPESVYGAWKEEALGGKTVEGWADDPGENRKKKQTKRKGTKSAESGKKRTAETEQKKKGAGRKWPWGRRENSREEHLLCQEGDAFLGGGMFGEEPFAEAETDKRVMGSFQGETRLLSDRQGKRLTLYGANPTIAGLPIHRDSFLIGKKEGAVDGLIVHPTISRIHAKIEKREQGYFLTDLNSTNGTFVNDRLLDVNETVLLAIGDVVRFADVEYVVGV